MQRGLARPSIRQAFTADRVNIPGKVEALWQPLYDYQTLAATAVATQSFFQVPIGQSSKTIVDTNMDLAGQLPKGQAFQITGIQVEVLPGVTIASTTADNAFADDVYTVLRTGALELIIGSKSYTTQGNLLKFAPVNRLGGFAAAATTADESSYLYAQSTGREYSVADLLLESSQNFKVNLIGLPALPSTAAGRVGVTLNGFLHRNAQ